MEELKLVEKNREKIKGLLKEFYEKFEEIKSKYTEFYNNDCSCTYPGSYKELMRAEQTLVIDRAFINGKIDMDKIKKDTTDYSKLNLIMAVTSRDIEVMALNKKTKIATKPDLMIVNIYDNDFSILFQETFCFFMKDANSKDVLTSFKLLKKQDKLKDFIIKMCEGYSNLENIKSDLDNGNIRNHEKLNVEYLRENIDIAFCNTWENINRDDNCESVWLEFNSKVSGIF